MGRIISADGAAVPLMVMIQPISAVIFVIGFFIYELNEDIRHLNDGAYIDIQGFLAGIALSLGICHLIF